MKHYISTLGLENLYALKAKPYYSAPANYGTAFTSVWDEDGKERTMGVTLEELERIMEERGGFYD